MAMKIWMWTAWVLASVVSPVAAADVRLDSFRNAKNEMERGFYLSYLDGVKGGLMSYNAWLKSHGEQQAFCMPEHLAMTTEQTEAIMLRSADKRAARGEMLIGLLLLSGLKDTFPCENPGGGTPQPLKPDSN